MPRSSVQYSPTSRAGLAALTLAWLCALSASAPRLAADDEPESRADWSLIALPPATPLSTAFAPGSPEAANAPPPESLIVDPAVASTSYEQYPCSSCDNCGDWACGQPINWTAGPYLKVGVPFVIGSSLLEIEQDSGWIVQGGMRQPLARGIAGDNVFIDLGGSHMSAFGETERITEGLVSNVLTPNVPPVKDPDAFTSTLKELQRSTVHFALGYYWGSPADERNGGWDVRLATRFGGRAGSMRGRFGEVLDPVLANNALLRVKPTHAKTDITGGLFFDVEAIFLQRAFRYGSIQWTIDCEYANDWAQYHGFDAGTLGTGSIMAGVMFSR